MGSVMMLVVIAVVVIGFLVLVYNGLVAKRVACENGWSQIDVQLKRRHDLIPNLVETVKGYASHEKDTLERVIQARNSAISASSAHDIAGQAQAENVISGALRQIFALSENYPDLKANQNFMQLNEELVSTENKISFARQHYNDAVMVYSTALEQLPGNLVKGFGNFPKMPYFELSAEESKVVQTAPKVSFS